MVERIKRESIQAELHDIRRGFHVVWYLLFVRTSLSVAVTLRKEGQVSSRGKTPNGLNASATLAKGDKECQYYFSGELSISIPQTQSAFHPPAQRTASRRRDVCQQSRWFARWNQSLRHSPHLHPALLRLSAMIFLYFMRRFSAEFCSCPAYTVTAQMRVHKVLYDRSIGRASDCTIATMR